MYLLDEAVIKEAMLIRRKGVDFRLIDRCRKKAVGEDMKDAKGESYEVAKVVAWVRSMCGALVMVNEQAKRYTTSVTAIDEIVGGLMFQYMEPEQQQGLSAKLPRNIQECKTAEAWLSCYDISSVAARLIELKLLQKTG